MQEEIRLKKKSTIEEVLEEEDDSISKMIKNKLRKKSTVDVGGSQNDLELSTKLSSNSSKNNRPSLVKLENVATSEFFHTGNDDKNNQEAEDDPIASLMKGGGGSKLAKKISKGGGDADGSDKKGAFRKSLKKTSNNT
mmetsp:Transcript_33364/g.30332  ORF Transcript_33364/g.30332 Transcript_33364/m.30332 type:complete len:138 (+) Transcript_33364:175-588(+)